MSLKIHIVHKNAIIRTGINAIFSPNEYQTVVSDKIERVNDVDVLLVDYTTQEVFFESLKEYKKYLPNVRVIAITPSIKPTDISMALRNGVDSHLLDDCNTEELLQSVKETYMGNSFYCPQVLELLKSDGSESCTLSDRIRLSDREVEIIKLIAEGYTNKEIAEKLILSTHTIHTHRKNIMFKLGLKNTAGIVIYAVKEQIVR